MFKCVHIICAKYCELRYMLHKLARLLHTAITASKFALFSVSGLKDEKLTKIANLHEN